MARQGESSTKAVQGKKRNERQRNSGEATFPCSVVHRDVYHRLNFMYQANIYLDALGSLSQAQSSWKGKARDKQQSDCSAVEVRPSARDVDYCKLAKDSMKSSFRTIAVHQTLRLDSSLKRTVCSGCGTVLIPGLTARVRVRPSKVHFQKVHTTCLSCRCVTSLPAPPGVASGDNDDPVASSSGKQRLDGPNRARRRNEAQRPVPFNDRELVGEGSGHELWNAKGKIAGWGVDRGAVALDEGQIEDSAATAAPPAVPRVQGSISKSSRRAEAKTVSKALVGEHDEEAMMNA